MERLDFSDKTKYNSIEGAIHFNRYAAAKPFVRGKRVLDIACGEGYGCALMKKWGAESVVGVDISEEAVSIAKDSFQRTGIEYIVHDVEQLPFENNSFDVVVSLETIEHLDHPEQFLKEISRVVRFDGQIIVSCPNDPYYSKSNPNFSNPFHKREYSYFDFKTLTQKFLGERVDWYLGFALNGFMTYPVCFSTFPEEGVLDALSMKRMLQAQDLPNAFLIAADRHINHWNCNYYLGIWNSPLSSKDASAVLFPREFFSEPEDVPYIDVTEFKEKYSDLINFKNEYADAPDLRQKIHALKIQNERFSSLLDLEKKEKELLLCKCQKECDEIRQEKELLSCVRQKDEDEKNLLRQQLNKANSELAHSKYLIEELNTIRRSRSFRLVQKYWNVKTSIKNAFKL